MNKKNLIILVITIILIFIFAFLLLGNYMDIKRKSATEKFINDASIINTNSAFSIDRIDLYSSAYATNVSASNNLWSLTLYQYTDISLSISNIKEQNITGLYIDNFSCDKLETGVPNFYLKNLYDIGKFELKDENLITDKIDYEIISPNSELDYSKPQIYSDLSNPITLEYINCISPDFVINNNKELTYDGSLLKSANISLSSISPIISFKLHVIDTSNEEHIYTISFKLPLYDVNSSIYNGSFRNTIENSVRF